MTASVRGLYIDFDNARRLEFDDFEIEAGKAVAVTGRSGSGKSTLLALLAGLLLPSSGTLTVCGIELTPKTASRVTASLRRSKIAYVGQEPRLIPELSIMENLSISSGLFGESRTVQYLDWLERLEVVDHRHKFPNQLSGGEIQRVVLARALANEPELLLADEPTSFLDEQRANLVIEAFSDMAATQALAVATHDPHMVEIEREYELEFVANNFAQLQEVLITE